MSADRRRKRGLWHMAVDDPYRKMVAVGLAVMLWFFINSRIMDSTEFQLPLKTADQSDVAATDSDELVVYLPTERVVKPRFFDGDREITSIGVKLSGPRYKIDALKENRLRLKIMTFLDRQWNGRQSGSPGGESAGDSDIEIVEFSIADIERDPRRDGVKIELVPARVRLEVEVRDYYELSISNNRVLFDARGNNNRLRLDTATYSPSVVTLLGPRNSIRRLDEQKLLFKADLNIIGLATQVTATLTVINGVAMGVYPESTVTVTIQLLPRRESYTLELPILVYDQRKDRVGHYEPVQKRMAVNVSFSGSLGLNARVKTAADLKEWASQYFRLEVYVPKLSAAGKPGDRLELQLYLVPLGTLLRPHERREWWLESNRTVTLIRK